MPTGERLGPMDATLLYMETATSSSNIGLICRFDGPIPFDDFVDDFKRHRIQRLPRFRQVIAPVPLNLGFPTWEDAPDFVLEHHVHRVDLEPPGSLRQLSEAVDRSLGQRIDLRRPPWDLTVVNGLADGCSAVIVNMQHCITDGVGITKILDALFDSTPAPFNTDASEEALPKPSPLPGPVERLKGVMRDRVARRRARKKRPAELPADASRRKAADKERLKAFGNTMKEFVQAPGIRLPFNAPISGRVHYGGASFDLEAFRRIATVSGGTLNDVLLTVLGGAIDRLANEHGLEVQDKFCRVYQAANVRSADEQDNWGNRLAFMPALVPLGLVDPRERLRQTAAYTKKTKELGVREVADKMVRGFQTKLPPPMAKLGLRLMLARVFQKLGALSKRPPAINIYVTNVRLPDFTAYLGGRRMTHFSGRAPLVPNTGVTCAAVNYGDLLHIGITADSESMPDVDGFSAYIHQAFDELLAASDGQASSPTVTP
ncbi:MAG: DUF1298 domain-containing protein [bacterium]|nr:DUF1298 domain-containing protein [bacterium]